MSRGKFPRPGCPCRDTRNPCSFCAVAIFVNLGTDLRDQPLQALNTKANLSRHIIMLNQNKAYRCHFNKKKCRYSLISSNFNLGATWWFILTMAYCSISGLVTKKINSFADISLVDVCSCVTHESLQARRYSLQAVPGSLQTQTHHNDWSISAVVLLW